MTESRQGINVEAIPCSCGRSADRVQVYAPVIDLGMAARASDKRQTRQDHQDFFEARDLVGDSYDSAARNGDPVRKRDFLGEAKREARKKGVAIR